MSIINASIFYVHLKTLWLIFYLNCIKYFSVRRTIFTVVLYLIFTLLAVAILVFRILDEILYPGYRKMKIESPVFIISNPRSGTTFLHRLLCLDGSRFSYTLLFQTITPSISLQKLIGLLGKMDRSIGRPLRRFFDWLDEVLFGGWKDIHPMGFNQSEEDEGMFIFSLLSAGVYLLCPYVKELDHIKFLDHQSEKQRKSMMRFYENTLKRFMYANGDDTIYLSKNVLSTGRIKSMLEIFPDARIIYLLRHPYKSVPSLTSMFTKPWHVHSKDIPDNSAEARELGMMAVEFYEYFYREKDRIAPANLVTVRYDDLVSDPFHTVKSIYDHFSLEMSDEFVRSLQTRSRRSKSYRSSHSYSLEQYGFSKEEIYDRLEPLFTEFNFKK